PFDLAGIPHTILSTLKFSELHSLCNQRLGFAEIQGIANCLKLGGHLAGEHFEIAYSEQPGCSAHVSRVLERDKLLFFVDSASGWQAVRRIEGQKIETLCQNEHVRNKFAASTRYAVRYVVTPIAGVCIRRR